MIPRIELHCHLDCSMRLTTIAELAAEAGLRYERPIAELAVVPAGCRSLIEFLTAVDIEVDVLQSTSAIERAAFELVEDFHHDGVIHGEVRFAPHLHQRNGDSVDAIVDAVSRGARRSAARYGLSTSLIVCALRHRDPREGLELVEASRRLPGRVDGVDLAGPEAGHPATGFKPMFDAAREDGLGITIHAGEADGPKSVWDAIDLGATRIGHGVRSVHDPELVRVLAKRGVTLECCPTCNVVTQAVPTIEDHPIDVLATAGVATTVSTDARTCLPTTLDGEFDVLRSVFGWGREREVDAQLAAARAAFVDDERRSELARQVLAAVTSSGGTVSPGEKDQGP